MVDARDTASEVPITVGPYRVEEPLGRGGMGEVFRGRDPRLDRSVALKRIKPDAKDPELARRRFRREARTAARLNHRAIVQVHDWIETDDGDWIVMELVRGRSLNQLLSSGPLAVERVIAIAREVASGLEAAHSAGLVHRDLKAENVHLTDSGDVKILDFGLARSVTAWVGSDGAPTDASLTADGRLLGTVTAMSPEQAMGEPVDHRSDLFSLGILLYELLTGRSPFRGASPVETLTRICTTQETPVVEHRPDVLQALSNLIGRLLRKPRARRPQSAREVLDVLDQLDAGSSLSSPSAALSETTIDPDTGAWAAPPSPASLPSSSSTYGPVTARHTRRWLPAFGVAAILGIAALALRPWTSAPSPPPTLVVVPETAVSGADTRAGQGEGPAGAPARLVARAVHDGVLRALLGYRRIQTIEPQNPVLERDDPAALARSFAAAEVLVSEVACRDQGLCEIVLRRVRADGVLLWRHRFSAATEVLLDLSRSVADQLRGGYPDAALRDGIADLAVHPEDYAAYLALRERARTRGGGRELHAELPEIASLQETSPRFLAPYLLAASISRLRFVETRNADDLERALQAVERARTLAPADPRTLRSAADVYLDGGRLDEAEAVLAELRRLEPGDAHAYTLEARLLERRGDLEGAGDRLREAVRRQPSWAHHSNLADFAYRTGNLDTARRSLEAMMERSPGNFDGLSRLAQLELLSGSPERAAELYEELVRHVPEETELTNLGVAYLLLARYADASGVFRQALDKTPTSPYALLNLADAELLRGQSETASDLYGRVLHQVERDPDAQALLTVRAQALARLGRAEDAVAAVRDALRQAPDNPQWAYEAALVYSVVGDRTSALVEARRALEQGVEPRWFGFPWFDALRDQLPELAASGG